MTKKADLKARVRARMAETSETYQQALEALREVQRTRDLARAAIVREAKRQKEQG